MTAGDAGPAPRFRALSRVLLVAEDGRMLLIEQHGKHRDVPRWTSPGGGVDPGESHGEAAIREVLEETGQRLASIAPAFVDEDFAPDQRWHAYVDGHWAWYAAPIARFELDTTGWTDEEREEITRWAWFTPEELEADGGLFEPADLPDRMRTASRLAREARSAP